jgi:hypothetical protein
MNQIKTNTRTKLKKRSKEDIEQILNRPWSMYVDEVQAKSIEHDRSSYRTRLIYEKISPKNK